MLNRQNYNVNATNAPPWRRAGFSLVEILVVMGILGILIVLIVTAISPLLGGARVAATQTTIAQINDVIQARYEAIKNADVSVEAKKLATLNSSVNLQQAEFLIRKTLYRQALPQRLADAFGLDGSLGGDDDAPYVAVWNSKSGNKTLANARDSSEFFLFVLSNGSTVRALKNGKSYPVPVLELDNINSNHLANQDNNFVLDSSGDPTGEPLYELVDDWGQPLRFYNFPTRLLKDNGTDLEITNAKILINGLPADASVLEQDPLDPTGLLRNPFTSGGSLTVQPGDSVTITAMNESNYHGAETYYVPLLVSAGPDNLLGLHEPTAGSPDRLAQVSTAADMTDNITNRQQ